MRSHGVEHEELQAYLDRELDVGRMEEIRRHLSGCAECSAVVRDLQQVSASLQSWQVEPAPASLRAPKIEEAKPAIRWTWPRLVLAFGGTAAVVLLMLAISLPNLMQSRQQAEMAKRTDRPVLIPSAPDQPPAPPAAPTASTSRLEGQRSRGKLARRGQEMERKHAEADRPATLAGLPEPQPPASADQMAARRADESFRQLEPAEGRQESDFKDEVAAKSAPAAAAPAARGVVGGLSAAQKRANAEEARRLIAYSVSMAVEVKEFAPARDKLLGAVDKAGGYVSEASTAETPGEPRRGDYTLRVPADKLQATLADLRGLGRVLNEQLSTDEVTEQVVDLEARIRNARATEQRLIAVLNERTGKVRDILEVEREIARTRQGIERMEAQRQNLMHRVELATIQVSLIEEYKAPLAPAPTGTATRLRNAFVAGWDDFAGMFLGLAFFFARNGLTLLFWSVILWLLWRRLKPRLLRLVTATQ
jgi:hypothetical protein